MEDNCNCIAHYEQGYEDGQKAALNKKPVTFDIDRDAIAGVFRDELDCVFEGNYQINIKHPADKEMMTETQDWVFMLSVLSEKCRTNITAIHFIPDSDTTDIVLQLIED